MCNHAPTQVLPLSHPEEARIFRNIWEVERTIFCNSTSQHLRKQKGLSPTIVVTWTSWLMTSYQKNLKIDILWKLAIEAYNRYCVFAATTVSSPSVSQLPVNPLLNIDLQIWGTLCVVICLILLYQIYNIDYTRKYISINWKPSTV